MKKAITAIFICFFAFAATAEALSVQDIDSLKARYKELVQTLTTSVRVAKLMQAEPDSEILLPVKGAKVKHIADTWKAPRPGGREHLGQDIFAKKGTPVVSATYGFVVRIGENTNGGRTVMVLGAGGHRYYYAHLDSYAPDLSLWQEVEPGTVLGTVGQSGNAAKTPPHLHFGVYTPKGPINPLSLMRESSPLAQQS